MSFVNAFRLPFHCSRQFYQFNFTLLLFVIYMLQNVCVIHNLHQALIKIKQWIVFHVQPFSHSNKRLKSYGFNVPTKPFHRIIVQPKWTPFFGHFLMSFVNDLSSWRYMHNDLRVIHKITRAFNGAKCTAPYCFIKKSTPLFACVVHLGLLSV